MKWLRELWAPARIEIGITQGLRKELDDLPPGQGLRLTSADGAQYVIIPADDFDHIAGLAGLVATVSSGEKMADFRSPR